MITFFDSDNEAIVIISFKDGIATIQKGYIGISIFSYIKKILKEWSSLERMIQEKYKTNNSLDEICTKINGIEIHLKKGENAEMIYDKWKQKLSE